MTYGRWPPILWVHLGLKGVCSSKQHALQEEWTLLFVSFHKLRALLGSPYDKHHSIWGSNGAFRTPPKLRWNMKSRHYPDLCADPTSRSPNSGLGFSDGVDCRTVRGIYLCWMCPGVWVVKPVQNTECCHGYHGC